MTSTINRSATDRLPGNEWALPPLPKNVRQVAGTSMLRRIAGLAAAAATLATVLVLAPVQATSALAYDINSCSTSTQFDVDRFIINKDVGDFGDSFHLGGVPKGDAVSCWSSDRTKVQVRGRVYNDNYGGCIRAVIRLYRSGQSSPIRTYTDSSMEVCAGGRPRGLLEKPVNVLFPTSNVNQVCVFLERKGISAGSSYVEIAHKNTYYGD